MSSDPRSLEIQMPFRNYGTEWSMNCTGGTLRGTSRSCNSESTDRSCRSVGEWMRPRRSDDWRRVRWWGEGHGGVKNLSGDGDDRHRWNREPQTNEMRRRADRGAGTPDRTGKTDAKRTEDPADPSPWEARGAARPCDKQNQSEIGADERMVKEMRSRRIRKRRRSSYET